MGSREQVADVDSTCEDEFRFEGPIDTFDRPEPYLEALQKLSAVVPDWSTTGRSWMARHLDGATGSVRCVRKSSVGLLATDHEAGWQMALAKLATLVQVPPRA